MAHPKSNLTHHICEDCWNGIMDEPPVRMEFELAKCCFCGELRNIDIFVRAASEGLQCSE